VQRADFVIDTGGTFGDTNRQVDRVVEKLLELSAAAGR
jgi:dephospho-CoA kinase